MIESLRFLVLERGFQGPLIFLDNIGLVDKDARRMEKAPWQTAAREDP